MSATDIHIGASAVEERRRRTWASGDSGVVAPRIALMAERLVDSAGLRAGDAVLDVATGTGNAAFAAARRGCEVTGVDHVEALLERGRERAAADGLSVNFMQGDAQDLQYADASFDAVLSCVGVMFTPDHVRAAGELVRVCRPGGTIALANWTPASFVGAVFQVVAEYVPTPSLMWSPGVWGTDEHVRRLLGRTVGELAFTRREFVFRFRSPKEFVEVFRDYYGPVSQAFDALDEGGCRALYEDLGALVAGRDREPGASVAVPSEYLEAVAVRAS
jgi:ubiquinone/menaquinone biosynthesis C-methylase UbiE